jgi:type I restriction enzyme S subunit
MIDYGEGGQNVGRVSASVTRQTEAESGAHVGLHDEAANPTYVDSPIKYDLRWPVVSLAEIATKIGSGATPKGGADAYLPSRARFALVRSQNVFDRRFDHDGLAFITDEQADGLRGVVLQPNDILLNITGDGITFGRACMVPKDVLPACVNQHVSIVRLNPLRADAGYVLAYLTHPEVKSYIESFNAGGSRRAVTKGHIESFRLPLPPLPEQRAIARILGTLDDKIELNRRMNETLEAMARALFKSWFVDFDPVRAKAEGRDPGLPKPLADLFPDSFEDSELGEIPNGWKVTTLRDLASQLSRGISPAYVETGGICVLNQKCIRDRRVDFSKARRHDCSKKSTDGRTLHVLDILVNSTGVGTLGRIAQLWHLPESAIIDSHVTVIRAAKDVDPWFLGISLIGRETDVEAFGEGSTGQTELSRTRLGELACLLPPEVLQASFGKLVGPLLTRLSVNEQASNTLAALRDTLLPKLISGELRVQAAEHLLEGASA